MRLGPDLQKRALPRVGDESTLLTWIDAHFGSTT